jgi:hypothetical protein
MKGCLAGTRPGASPKANGEVAPHSLDQVDQLVVAHFVSGHHLAHDRIAENLVK